MQVSEKYISDIKNTKRKSAKSLLPWGFLQFDIHILLLLICDVSFQKDIKFIFGHLWTFKQF